MDRCTLNRWIAVQYVYVILKLNRLTGLRWGVVVNIFYMKNAGINGMALVYIVEKQCPDIP